MAARRDPRPATRPERDLQQDSIHNDYTLQDEWTAEANQTIDESELRGKPEWLEAIGDDEDTEPIERNLNDYGWSLQGEDDYVSDPTGASDSPDWVDDDYDDEDDLQTRDMRDADFYWY